jgi:hypothetical protein
MRETSTALNSGGDTPSARLPTEPGRRTPCSSPRRRVDSLTIWDIDGRKSDALAERLRAIGMAEISTGLPMKQRTLRLTPRRSV